MALDARSRCGRSCSPCLGVEVSSVGPKERLGSITGSRAYSYDQSASIVGVAALYDGNDDFACLWSDPAHGITWPAVPTSVSDRDAGAPTLAELRSQLGESLRLAT